MWKFFKDFMIYGFASVLGKLASIFLMPVYTSILTKEEYGAMALITSCKGIIDLISNLNIHSGIARDYYEVGDNRKKLVSTGLWSILAMACIVCLILITTRSFWGEHILGLDHVYMMAFTIMIMTIPTGSLMSYFAILTRFKKKPTLYAIGNIVQLTMQIGISVLCVVYMRIGIIGIFLGFLISEIIATLYFAMINRNLIGFTYKKQFIKRALLFCLPTLPAILAGWLDSSVGQIVIGKYISITDLGVYSIALSLASAFTLISTAFQNVWSPFLYENYTSPAFNKEINKLFASVSMALLFITITLSLFSREIILLLSNSGYLEATKYVALLCFPMSVYMLFPFATSGISISRNTKHIGFSYITGSFLNIIALVFLVPRFGVIAVPLCLAISRVATYLYLYEISKQTMQFYLPHIFIGIIGICALTGYVLANKDIHLTYRIVLSLIAYTSIYIYLRKKLDINISIILRK